MSWLAEKQGRIEVTTGLRCFGNFVDPYLPESSVVKPEAIYRGDVVPVEAMRGTGQLGGLNLYGSQRTGAASYSIEPFQAYRYSMMKRDGRLDRALRDSPSGQAVRRIAQDKSIWSRSGASCQS